MRRKLPAKVFPLLYMEYINNVIKFLRGQPRFRPISACFSIINYKKASLNKITLQLNPDKVKTFKIFKMLIRKPLREEAFATNDFLVDRTEKAIYTKTKHF